MIEKSQMYKIDDEFQRRIRQNSFPKIIQIPPLLTEIKNCDLDSLELCFGKFGLDLKKFIENIDLLHPDVQSIFDGILSDDNDFSKDFIELINLSKLAKQNNLNKVLPLLSKDYFKNLLPKSLIKKIESPSRLYLRMLKDSSDRNKLRQNKKMQNIDLQGVYSKGNYFWDSQPSSFSKFLRFDDSYLEDLEEAQKKAKRYKELGCISLEQEINKSIESFKELFKDNHFGFNRITITNAAIILAKSLGFKFTSQEKVNNFGSIRLESEIKINKNFFEGINFSIDENFFDYQPRIYPIHDFMHIASEDTKTSISHLESFPEAFGKPIFDHFGVIVPSISLNKDENGFYNFIFKGMHYSFEDKDEAEKKIDLILIKNEYIPSIIVGDKDGKCYFLSYFNVKKTEI